MNQTASRLTVFFDAPFWVGVYERITDGQCTVCKITFGAEPKDYDVYDWLLRSWRQLTFSPPVRAETCDSRPVNPKRLQREIHRQLQHTGVGTKAQQALQLQHEEGKLRRRTRTRQEREAEKDRQFALRQAKRKQKHRGH